MVAAAIGGSAAAGLAGSMISSSQAAGAQKNAADLQSQMWQQEQANLAPYYQAGVPAVQTLQSELAGGQLGQPFQMTQAQLEKMPGYQFQLQQGLESVQNAAAMRGLGVSGAAMKGAAQFATGLANQNFQTAFNDYWANQNNRYTMLSGLSQIGANAAAGTAQAGVQAGANIGNMLSAAGQSQAAGTMGGFNALGQLGSIGYAQQLLGGGSTTGSSGSVWTAPTQMSGYAGAVTPGSVGPGGFVG